jgi:hypothetical protein
MTTDQHAVQAKQLMRHYLHMAIEGSGQHWDSDNADEVSDIVDHIIGACTPDTPPQPDALTRIAVALERIADALKETSDLEHVDFMTKLYAPNH